MKNKFKCFNSSNFPLTSFPLKTLLSSFLPLKSFPYLFPHVRPYIYSPLYIHPLTSGLIPAIQRPSGVYALGVAVKRRSTARVSAGTRRRMAESAGWKWSQSGARTVSAP